MRVALEDLNKGYVVCDPPALGGRIAYMLALLGLFLLCGVISYFTFVYRIPSSIVAIITILMFLMILDINCIIFPSIVEWLIKEKMKYAEILGISCTRVSYVVNVLMSLDNILNLDIVEENWGEIQRIIDRISDHDEATRRYASRFFNAITHLKSGRFGMAIELAKKEMERKYGRNKEFALAHVAIILIMAYICFSTPISLYEAMMFILGSICLSLISWRILKREHLIRVPTLFANYKLSPIELVELLGEIQDSARELGKSIVRFIAHRLQVDVVIGDYKYSISTQEK